MRGRRELKAMWRDPNMKELIDSLWREYYGLYTEKYSRDPERWLQNYLSPDVDFGQAIGQDHSINGNQSTVIGIGAITRTFREIVLGSYATEDLLANPTEWVELNRLITVGNGLDDENRSDALILFKSGLLKIFNAIKIGKYEHGPVGELVEPEDGTLQYTESGLSIRYLHEWISLMPHDNYLYIAYASDAAGTGFTMTFDPDLDYIALLRSDTKIEIPEVTDFAGLWKKYKGSDGAQGIQGVDGAEGINGTDGADGFSAYQIALNNNFIGTEADWLLSLTGADGINGIDGADGADGIQGAAGADGSDGIQGTQGIQGIQGVAGPGLAAGGTTGQKAVKKSNTDYDTEWVDDTATAAARVLMIKVMSDNATVTDGNGKMKFPIPQELNGLKITKAEAAVTTASSSGVIAVGVYNYTSAKEILSTGILIDVGEYTSYTSAVPSVVNAANNTVATGDLIGIDVDAAGINARGLTIILTF